MWSKLDEKQPIVFLRNLLKGAKARATTHTGVQVVHCTNVYTKEKWGWNLAHGLLPNYISWNRATKRMGNLFYSILFLFGGATPSACRSFQERDHTHTTGATQATGVTMPDPQPVVPQENSKSFLNSHKVTVCPQTHTAPLKRRYLFLPNKGTLWTSRGLDWNPLVLT